MVTATTTRSLRELVADVPDPEIPILTIDDLGILRDVRSAADGAIEVDITPTYSGCPAMDAIRDDITQRLTDAGYERVRVRLVLAPAWTTDWISDDGRRKLAGFGIAPPSGTAAHRAGPVSLTLSVRCPRCGSPDTRELSRFGSTACKALWRCNECREPFDHFKAL
jgi:ring-1,2-phenylacetyl-CoA epoxidase subunit PaaD